MILKSLLLFLFPPICPACKKLKVNEQDFCLSCLNMIIPLNEMESESYNELLIEKVYCYQKTEIWKILQMNLRENHPKHIKTLLSFFLIGIENNALTFDGIYSSKKDPYYVIAEKLAMVFKVPFYASIQEVKGLHLLTLEKELSSFYDCELINFRSIIYLFLCNP